MKSLSMTFEMKAIEQYIPMILLGKAVLSFISVDESLKCDHWNEGFRFDRFFSCGAVYHSVKNGSKFNL